MACFNNYFWVSVQNSPSFHFLLTHSTFRLRLRSRREWAQALYLINLPLRLLVLQQWLRLFFVRGKTWAEKKTVNLAKVFCCCCILQYIKFFLQTKVAILLSASALSGSTSLKYSGICNSPEEDGKKKESWNNYWLAIFK